MFLLVFILYGTLSCMHFLDLSECFPYYVREVFGYNLLKYFLRPFLSLFSFWEPDNVNVGVFNGVPEVSETILISFHSFFFILFCSSDFHQSVSSLLTLLGGVLLPESMHVGKDAPMAVLPLSLMPPNNGALTLQ